ncbi:MAG TPA: class II aldolase/adducin family protein [Blastocatellia bacterium]|nr:class II aldolase/adducin family protein [Blastocatellia bacterium]
MSAVGSPSLRETVAAEEWEARVNLAAAYRLVALHGWDDLVFTHISMRVPGPEHHFLINPYGLLFDEITASSLVKVGLDGNPVGETPYPVNPAGFVIHSAVHAAREDALCVMHLHTEAGIAVSAQTEGLLPISQQAMFVVASLGYHDYEGVALSDDEKPRLVEDLGTNTYLILRNHGLLTVGPTPADAFLSMFLLERSCRVQVLAQSGGASLTRIPKAIIKANAEQMDIVTLGLGSKLVWPAMLRKLDRVDPSFRQ